MKANSSEKEVLSRRKLLKNAGVLAVGSIVAGGVLGGNQLEALSAERVRILVNDKEVTGPVPASIVKGTTVAPIRSVAEQLGAQVDWDRTTRTVRVVSKTSLAGSATAPAWPWPFKKLDPAVVSKRGYENYYKGGCMFGAAAALLITLKEKVGYPYNLIPMDMFKYGAGGAASWGTLCGALNGCGAILNLVHKDYAKILDELIGWYTEYPFPSRNHEAYCHFPGQQQTISESPLCHASVSKWSATSHFKVGSEEKKDRCAKLTGDTAAKAAEMLNTYMDGKFIAAYKPHEEFSHCMACHTGNNSVLDNEQGKMNCVSCHQDHTK